MKFASKFSAIRTTISVILFAACVLLAALAVRSHWWRDSLIATLPNENSLAVQSSAGQLLVGVFPERRAWRAESEPTVRQAPTSAALTRETYSPHFNDTPFHLGTIIVVPHWYVALVLGACAAVPWIRWHFGLRTLAGGIAVAAASLTAAIFVY